MELAGLHLYPVKSCRGLSPARWGLDGFGLRFDRSFMVVDASGRFLTQRELPGLARVGAEIAGHALVLTVPGHPPLSLALDAWAGKRIEVAVWRHRGPALDQGDAAAALLGAHLGVTCRLVRVPPDHARRVNPVYSPEEAFVGFADGYPLLLISEASLAELNARLAKPVPMNRFRPNLVVRGCAPFAEDGWKRIRIGGIAFDVVKPCDRCVIPTTDQATGERDGPEPLRTLASYRSTERGVPFGQNLVHRAGGTLAVGMPVEVLTVAPREAAQ